MRTYGRVDDGAGNLQWVEVETQPNGANDYVYITTLAQCLKLVLGESPFYANHGIPSEQAIIQQIFPDFYVNQTQQQFAGYFASLIVTKIPDPTPTYRINIVTNYGTSVQREIPI
jgi:hypothetical protein